MTTERTGRPAREAPELGAAIARMVAALVRRAGDGDLFALEELAQLRAGIALSIAAAARAAHDGEAGYSWAEIGRELGISRQAAHKLYGLAEPDSEAAG